MKLNLKKYTSTLGGVLASIAATIIVILLLAVIYFYMYLPAATNHGETITVPSIEGLHVSELEDFLVKRTLRYEVNDSSFTKEYPPLTVLRQFPAAGSKVKENRIIYISLNRVTAPTVPLPDLANKTSLEGAEAILRSNELIRGKILFVRGPFLNFVEELRYNGEKVDAGTKIPKGSVIDIVVQDGGSNVIQIPNVLGYTLEDAKVPIFGSNLNISIEVVGDTLGGTEPVVVLKQKPRPGENIKVGDVVEVWVGKKGTPLPDEEGEDNKELEDPLN